MTKCYDCDLTFDLFPNEIVGLVGYGDYFIEEDGVNHYLVNLDNGRDALINGLELASA